MRKVHKVVLKKTQARGILKMIKGKEDRSMTHPLFMIDKQHIKDIRARMQTDAEFRARAESLISRRYACISEEFLTEEYANSVYSQHGNYYDIGSQLHRLAYIPVGLLLYDIS